MSEQFRDCASGLIQRGHVKITRNIRGLEISRA